MGLDQEKCFHRYHRVLSRAGWSSRKVSRVLLGLLLEAFVPEGSPVVVGIDETLERRYGKKISARGVYRDPVRSTHETFVKGTGLRWVCVMLLVEIPWASRVWALPFLSALAPSERYAAKRGRRHKKITEWAWQLLLQLRHWYPQREIVAVADRAYASLKLLSRCRSLSRPVTFITRLRLDAALYERGPAAAPGPDRETAHKGRAAAKPFCGGRRSSHRLGAYRDSELVRERAAHGRDSFSVGRLVLHGLACRACALGFGARPRRRVQNPGPPLHRPRCRSGADSRLVCDALAARGDLPRGAQAPGIRDAEIVDGVGDPKNHPGSVGAVLGDHPVRPWADGAGSGCS
jgi:hypothetical protein